MKMYLEKFETDRLFIRKLRDGDEVGWESFFKNNPNLPFLGLNLNLSAKEQSREWIDIQLLRYKNKRFGHKALIDKVCNKLIGQAGLLTQEIEGKTEIEIGYHIIPEYWGNGYATEAAIKFRDYAFEKKITNTLVSVIDLRNIGSQNVAKKIGMIQSNKTKYFGLDVYIYRINKMV